MRAVRFHADAWRDFTLMASEDPKLFNRLVRLINETMREPFTGIGKRNRFAINSRDGGVAASMTNIVLSIV